MEIQTMWNLMIRVVIFRIKDNSFVQLTSAGNDGNCCKEDCEDGYQSPSLATVWCGCSACGCCCCCYRCGCCLRGSCAWLNLSNTPWVHIVTVVLAAPAEEDIIDGRKAKKWVTRFDESYHQPPSHCHYPCGCLHSPSLACLHQDCCSIPVSTWWWGVTISQYHPCCSRTQSTRHQYMAYLVLDVSPELQTKYKLSWPVPNPPRGHQRSPSQFPSVSLVLSHLRHEVTLPLALLHLKLSSTRVNASWRDFMLTMNSLLWLTKSC